MDDGVADRLRAAGCVFAEEEAQLLRDAARNPAELESYVVQRASGTPIEYVVGWAQFDGQRIEVDPGVFVPRIRSEFIAVRGAQQAQPGDVVVDMCCGAGGVGVAVASRVDGIDLYASDVDPAAVACARRNVAALGGKVFEGDLFDALPPVLRGRVDVLIANAPYVPSGSIALLPAEARDFEPRLTLDGGTDGLDFHRRFARDSPVWLAEGGRVLIEVDRRSALTAVQIFVSVGFEAQQFRDDDLDATVVIARLPQGSQLRA